MEKAVKEKIIKQIKRLCEKQYRKGFQQGFYACKDNEMTVEAVNKFRRKGADENYSQVVQPHTGRKNGNSFNLFAELAIPDMEELYCFLT